MRQDTYIVNLNIKFVTDRDKSCKVVKCFEGVILTQNNFYLVFSLNNKTIRQMLVSKSL